MKPEYQKQQIAVVHNMLQAQWQKPANDNFLIIV